MNKNYINLKRMNRASFFKCNILGQYLLHQISTYRTLLLLI